MAAEARGGSRATPLFGRSEILAESDRLLVQAHQGHGSILVLEGAAGVGKSVFLSTATGRARSQGFQILEARARPSDLPEPYALLRELIESAPLHRPTGAAADSGAAELVPMFLAPLSGPEEPPGRARASDRASGGDEADALLSRLSDPGDRLRGERRGLFDRLLDFFRDLSEQHPILLAVDDLQWADRASLDFLVALSPAIERERIALVATIVPSGLVPIESSHQLDPFLRAPATRVLALRPLTEAELADYAKWLLGGREPEADALRRWYAQTEGNPLFVEQLVRLQGRSSGEAEGTAPADLDTILRRRYEALPELDRRTLVYAAVLGREFRFAVLARASGAPEEELTESLDRLARAGLLRERAEDRFEFASDRLRADVYGDLTETRRGILHRKVLASLEAGAPGGPSSVFDLARHAYLGRDDARSAAYNRRAAEAATDAFAFEEAARYLERALESQRRLPRRDLSLELRLLVELGRLLDELGDLNRAQTLLEDAVARARAMETGDRELAVALLGLARVQSDRVDLESARRLLREAFEILERIGDARALMTAHRILGVTLYRLGDLDGAEEHQRAELALAEREGTPSEQGHALVDLANTFISRGADRQPEALALYERAARIFADGRDETARARVLMNRGLLLHNTGRSAEALASLREAAEAAEHSRSRVWIGYTQLNLAQLLIEAHEPVAARKALDRGLSLLEPLGDRLAGQSGRMIRAMLAEEEGHLDAADAAYGEAIALAAELELRPDAAESLFRRARLAERRGTRAEARRFLSEALGLGLLELKPDLAAEARALARTVETPVGSTG